MVGGRGGGCSPGSAACRTLDASRCGGGSSESAQDLTVPPADAHRNCVVLQLWRIRKLLVTFITHESSHESKYFIGDKGMAADRGRLTGGRSRRRPRGAGRPYRPVPVPAPVPVPVALSCGSARPRWSAKAYRAAPCAPRRPAPPNRHCCAPCTGRTGPRPPVAQRWSARARDGLADDRTRGIRHPSPPRSPRALAPGSRRRGSQRACQRKQRWR